MLAEELTGATKEGQGDAALARGDTGLVILHWQVGGRGVAKEDPEEGGGHCRVGVELLIGRDQVQILREGLVVGVGPDFGAAATHVFEEEKVGRKAE